MSAASDTHDSLEPAVSNAARGTEDDIVAKKGTSTAATSLGEFGEDGEAGTEGTSSGSDGRMHPLHETAGPTEEGEVAREGSGGETLQTSSPDPIQASTSGPQGAGNENNAPGDESDASGSISSAADPPVATTSGNVLTEASAAAQVEKRPGGGSPGVVSALDGSGAWDGASGGGEGSDAWRGTKEGTQSGIGVVGEGASNESGKEAEENHAGGHQGARTSKEAARMLAERINRGSTEDSVHGGHGGSAVGERGGREAGEGHEQDPSRTEMTVTDGGFGSDEEEPRTIGGDGKGSEKSDVTSHGDAGTWPVGERDSARKGAWIGKETTSGERTSGLRTAVRDGDAETGLAIETGRGGEPMGGVVAHDGAGSAGEEPRGQGEDGYHRSGEGSPATVRQEGEVAEGETEHGVDDNTAARGVATVALGGQGPSSSTPSNAGVGVRGAPRVAAEGVDAGATWAAPLSGERSTDTKASASGESSPAVPIAAEDTAPSNDVHEKIDSVELGSAARIVTSEGVDGVDAVGSTEEREGSGDWCTGIQSGDQGGEGDGSIDRGDGKLEGDLEGQGWRQDAEGGQGIGEAASLLREGQGDKTVPRRADGLSHLLGWGAGAVFRVLGLVWDLVGGAGAVVTAVATMVGLLLIAGAGQEPGAKRGATLEEDYDGLDAALASADEAERTCETTYAPSSCPSCFGPLKRYDRPFLCGHVFCADCAAFHGSWRLLRAASCPACGAAPGRREDAPLSRREWDVEYAYR